jgi:riboflavin biosynthesis pyrimidine reductase
VRVHIGRLSRDIGHSPSRLRACHDAIMVGIDTLLADDSQLNGA